MNVILFVLSLPLHAVDLLRRTDDAAFLIQQKVRRLIIDRRKPLVPAGTNMMEVTDAALAAERDLEQQQEEQEGEVEEEVVVVADEEGEEKDWDRFYSLLLVAVFGTAMLLQRTFSKCFGKVDEDDNGVGHVVDVAQSAGDAGNVLISGGLTGAAPPAPPAPPYVKWQDKIVYMISLIFSFPLHLLTHTHSNTHTLRLHTIYLFSFIVHLHADLALPLSKTWPLKRQPMPHLRRPREWPMPPLQVLLQVPPQGPQDKWPSWQ
jgi:hypothetical protein